MALISRRDAGKLLLAGCAGALVPAGKLRGATMINSVIRGVQIGAQSYSFRDRPLDASIDAFREVGLGECELFDGHVLPQLRGEALTKWRKETPVSYFKDIRKKCDDAGILLYAFTYGFRKNFTDEEIERGFHHGPGDGGKVHHLVFQCQRGAARR